MNTIELLGLVGGLATNFIFTKANGLVAHGVFQGSCRMKRFLSSTQFSARTLCG